MIDSKYLEGIKLTGFGLEYSISKALLQEGWAVINNKYYIDDVQGSAREIDILAYKATTTSKGIQVFTVLIISCKKSSDKAWALLAKEKNHNDPNIDWTPVTLWSNEKILKLMIENYEWKENYVKSSNELREKIFLPEKQIFAFQELSQKNGKPQNDKNIFNSIVSSMKSQGYEIGMLEKRKKENSMYNFNLISIIDAPLVRIEYGNNEPILEHIDSDIYLGSYIINKKETLSRVHFIRANSFSEKIYSYNSLHSHNIKQARSIYTSFFHDCLKENKKKNLFIKDFNRKVKYSIYREIRNIDGNSKESSTDIDIKWNKKKNCVEIELGNFHSESMLTMLNSNIKLKAEVKDALEKYYKYTGEFYFIDIDIPF